MLIKTCSIRLTTRSTLSVFTWPSTRLVITIARLPLGNLLPFTIRVKTPFKAKESEPLTIPADTVAPLKAVLPAVIIPHK